MAQRWVSLQSEIVSFPVPSKSLVTFSRFSLDTKIAFQVLGVFSGKKLSKSLVYPSVKINTKMQYF